MNTKLTLTMEQSVIEKAKRYAQKNRRSLSDLIEGYLKIITNGEQEKKSDITPLVQSLKGSFQTSKNIDYKKELAKALQKKYKQ